MTCVSSEECTEFQLVLTKKDTNWMLLSDQPLIGSNSNYECNITTFDGNDANNRKAQLECSCQTGSCEKTTTPVPCTPPNNASEAILGSATGLLLVVLVCVMIGWICTCIIMRRRQRQYHINHRSVCDTHARTHAHTHTTFERNNFPFDKIL